MSWRALLGRVGSVARAPCFARRFFTPSAVTPPGDLAPLAISATVVMPVECRGSSAHGIRPLRTRIGRPAISMTGRISTVPTRAPGIRAAMRIVSARSLASIREVPPSGSQVSASSPGVTSGLPSRTPMPVAVGVGCSGLAARYGPRHLS
jgi:hypothetical protein